MISLKRVDVQLILVFFLIIPGWVYLFIYHNEVFNTLDFGKLLVSAISFSIVFLALAYIIRVRQILFALGGAMFTLTRQNQITIKSKKKVALLNSIIATASLSDKEIEESKTTLKDVSIKIRKVEKKQKEINYEIASILKNFYISSIAIDIPMSAVVVFLSTIFITLCNRYFIVLSSSMYITLLASSTILMSFLSNLLFPNLRDHYLTNIAVEQNSSKG